jgi:hypothetical protein
MLAEITGNDMSIALYCKLMMSWYGKKDIISYGVRQYAIWIVKVHCFVILSITSTHFIVLRANHWTSDMGYLNCPSKYPKNTFYCYEYTVRATAKELG